MRRASPLREPRRPIRRRVAREPRGDGWPEAPACPGDDGRLPFQFVCHVRPPATRRFPLPAPLTDNGARSLRPHRHLGDSANDSDRRMALRKSADCRAVPDVRVRVLRPQRHELSRRLRAAGARAHEHAARLALLRAVVRVGAVRARHRLCVRPHRQAQIHPARHRRPLLAVLGVLGFRHLVRHAAAVTHADGRWRRAASCPSPSR